MKKNQHPCKYIVFFHMWKLFSVFVNSIILFKRATIQDVKFTPFVLPHAFSQCPHACAPLSESGCVFVVHSCVFVYLCRSVADVWNDGDLPPGWREISDSSEVYFWHVPTGTTQYHRPVAAANQHSPPGTDPDGENDPCLEVKESLKPPNEVRGDIQSLAEQNQGSFHSQS